MLNSGAKGLKCIWWV